ncbi:MAG: sigma-70 family RNA polymerase sigma factor [Terricaulis silvestris]
MTRSAGLSLVTRADAEEASLWRRMRFEDVAGCRETLFERYLGLARALAAQAHRRRGRRNVERTEVEQLAYAGLLEAIDRFEPLHGAPFEAFAAPRIRGAIADGLAKGSEDNAQYSHRRRVQAERLRVLKRKANASDDPVSALADLVVALALGILAESASVAGAQDDDAPADLAGYDTLPWRELQVCVAQEVEGLPEAERTVMRQHYFNGVPFVQIATLLGVTKGRISQLHHAALNRLRERLRRQE